MTDPVLIFRHIQHEGPGYLGDFLQHRHIPYRMIGIDEGEPVPVSLERCSALVFMGGPMSVNDPLPWIADEIRLIQQAIEDDVPVLGHCLGGQLMAKALGAKVGRNKVTEIGWHNTIRIDNPASRDWLNGLDDEIELFHWHGETFSVPLGATPILTNQFCDNQAFVYGKNLALQCHVEMTQDLVRKWATEGADELHVSDSVQSADEMQQDLAVRVHGLNKIADTIYTRWIKGLAK